MNIAARPPLLGAIDNPRARVYRAAVNIAARPPLPAFALQAQRASGVAR